jgi:hypothetical protein
MIKGAYTVQVFEKRDGTNLIRRSLLDTAIPASLRGDAWFPSASLLVL